MKNFTTMITPYKKDGSVDYETAVKYVDWYFENGLDGIFAICQSSEIFYLSLEERVKLNTVVYNRGKELEKKYGRPFTIISSGHVSDSHEDQVKELNAVWESGTDGLILITNRLDINREGDDVWIKNAEELLKKLPKEAKLGLYECPSPYKRLVTPKILDWCLKTGRFYYMKDTCCDADEMARRCEQLKGSHFELYNANCQTLLESLRRGGKGYCGIMNNFHPKLYSWLCHNYTDSRADLVQSFIGNWGFTECLCYPLTAKYHMNLVGLPTELTARNREDEELRKYEKSCMEQLKMTSDYLEKVLGI